MCKMLNENKIQPFFYNKKKQNLDNWNKMKTFKMEDEEESKPEKNYINNCKIIHIIFTKYIFLNYQVLFLAYIFVFTLRIAHTNAE